MRTFEPGQCHHRGPSGKPDCNKRIEAKYANLCPEHERTWQKAARERRLRARGGMRSADGICAARPNGPYGIDAAAKCNKTVAKPWALLCTEHEALWQIIRKERATAHRAGVEESELRSGIRRPSAEQAAAPGIPPFDGAEIERTVMSGLKDFQRRTVDYVFKRLYTDPKPVNRFLVADEVGLGKTLVARGLVARSINRLQKQGVKRIDVIYICSNADIAAQNIRRLNVTGRQDFNLSSRITLLPLQLKKLNDNGLNFVSFTPGTSFDFGQRTGQAAERALLFRLLEHAWGRKAMDRSGAYRLMRASKRLDRFRDHVKWTPSGVGGGDNQIDPTLAGSFVAELAKAEEATGLKTRFFELVEIHTRTEPREYWHQRQEIVAELRRLLARSCIAALEPDLIILDEFQRFRHLLEDPNPDDPDDIRSLAHELFNQPDAKVLMLSATPYKMYTLSDEADDDHYRDFVKTSRFLLGHEAASGFSQDLNDFRRGMFTVGEGVDPSNLIRLKRKIERRLRLVMARTERLSVTEDRSGMLVHAPTSAMRLEARDLRSYILADRLSRKLGAGDAMEYWKSAPYLTNFMEGYKLKREMKKAIEPGGDPEIRDLLRSAGDDGLLSFDQIRAYEQVDPGNARLRALMADTLDRGAWQLLWMPPSLPYYEPGPPFDSPEIGDFTKRLIFSSWTVAPQAIACMLSYEAERRMVRKGHKRRVNTGEARKRQRGLLRFARDSRNQERLVGMPVFGLMYPSPTLARLGDPLQLASTLSPGRVMTQDVLLGAVEDELRGRLGPVLRRAPSDGPVDEDWYWAAPLILDARANADLITTFLGRANAAAAWDAGEAASEAESTFAAHVERAHDTAFQPQGLGRPPDDLFGVLARLAVAGPANAALRSLARAVGGPRKASDVPVREAAARVAWGYRVLFNVPEVMALVRTTEGGDEAYWRAVLEYSFAGNIQAVLDEYLHVLPEWLGLVGRHHEAQVAELAREVHDVISMRAANYGVEEVLTTEAGVSLESRNLRARYALRFGVRATDESASLHRAGLVRSAFNSPFWPFALASTSLGQEGLDFHQYCHAVVHWNLPANPVDMEQREGRVHRYKGHAVRKNVARVHSAVAFNTRGRDPWEPMFDAARPERSTHDRDLIPYWVYALEGGSRIERYVPALPLSRDSVKLEHMRRSLAAYRLVFGQPRQEDMLAYLGGRLTPQEVETLAQQLRIDLTPK